MQIDIDLLNKIIIDNAADLKNDNLRAVYDKIYTDKLGRIFIQSLINSGYSPEYIIEKMRGDFPDRLNTKLFKKVELPEEHRIISMSGVKCIMSGAFEDSDVKELTDTQDITRIDVSAFLWSSLETINLPAITEIAMDTFRGCQHLTEVTLGENLNYIGKDAFYFCHNLKIVIFGGSADQWTKIPNTGNIFEPGYLPMILFKK